MSSISSARVEQAYPAIAENFVLHLTPGEGYLRDVSIAPSAQKGDMHMLNDMAAEVLSRCDGQTTLAEVLGHVRANFAGEGFDLTAECCAYIGDLLQDGLVDLHTTPVVGRDRIRGSRQFECPSHFMIELTDQCNLRCAHCYRDSSPERDQFIATEKLLQILHQMRGHGVSTIELTGGEPTMRRDFLDIFHYCAEHFSSVAIVSNGWFITDEWARQMATYDNVIVQIDVDGARAPAHDTLRGRRGAFDHALRAGRAMSRHGVRYRAAMNLYSGNFDEIIETAALARDLGANWFSFSPVTDLGRGRGADMISFSQMGKLMDIARTLEDIHGADFVRLLMKVCSTKRQKTATVGRAGGLWSWGRTGMCDRA